MGGRSRYNQDSWLRLRGYKKDDEESKSFLKEGGEKDQQEEENYGDDYVEKRRFCCCCSLKCGIILFGIFLLIDFGFEIFEATDILMNEFMDEYYGIVYVCLVAGLFVAIILQFFYWCQGDSPRARSVLPWSFLIASIVNMLIFLWIIIYIAGLYPRDKVQITRYEKAEDPQEGES